MPELKRLAAVGLILVALAISALPLLAHDGESGGYSLRFYGSGSGDIDRVKIPLDDPAAALNVGDDFTVEFWMMAHADENGSAMCVGGEDNWIYGNIILDRDVFGSGDYGDYGVSLYGGVIAFGVNDGRSGTSLCGSTPVADSQWHHIALVRVRESGLMRIYVDGRLDAETDGPTGDIRYRSGRPTSWPNDPFLVIGAEKHDYDNTTYPSYSGWLDELRFSDTVRYLDDFTPPAEPFTPDDDTVGLYHFDDGSGDQLTDSSGHDNHGVLLIGGSPEGPEWSSETPWQTVDDPATAAPAPK